MSHDSIKDQTSRQTKLSMRASGPLNPGCRKPIFTSLSELACLFNNMGAGDDDGDVQLFGVLKKWEV